jgi:hypothetical protein
MGALILAMTPAEFQTFVLGWISVITVVSLALLGFLVKILPVLVDFIRQVKEALKGLGMLAALNANRLDQHREEINKIKREDKKGRR